MTLVEHMQMNSCPRCPLESWTVGLHSVLCWQCVYHFRYPYTLCVKIYNISIIIQSLKIMLLCGFHWHSRYIIWISTFVLLHTMWFTGSCCDQQLPSVARCHDNWLISSFINSTTHIHAYFLHIFTGFVTCDIHQWNGFDWFSQSWLWHWCMPSLHLEWYCATNDSGVYFYFCSSLEASSPLKMLSFLLTFMSFCDIYWT